MSRRIIGGSYAYPWDTLTEQQQTARMDEVLDWPARFVFITSRDAYRDVDAKEDSPDFAPADAVETRRQYRDGDRDSDIALPDVEGEWCSCGWGASDGRCNCG